MLKFRQGFCVILLMQFNPTEYIQSPDHLKGSLQSVSKAIKATEVFMLRGLVLSSVLLYILPVFMGGDGIWWGHPCGSPRHIDCVAVSDSGDQDKKEIQDVSQNCLCVRIIVLLV